MRKIALTVGSIACLGMGIGASQAEVCYNLVPFTDILRLNESMSLDQNGANHTQGLGPVDFGLGSHPSIRGV